MSSKITSDLYLDEFQSLGVEGREHADAYPSLTSEERRICDVIAAGLYLSKSSIQWALFNAMKGQKDSFKRILEILASKPVTMVTDDAKREKETLRVARLFGADR